MSKDVRRLIRELGRIENCEVSMGGRGHWKVRYRGRLVTTFPASPSCVRWERNARRDLIRGGIPLRS